MQNLLFEGLHFEANTMTLPEQHPATVKQPKRRKEWKPVGLFTQLEQQEKAAAEAAELERWADPIAELIITKGFVPNNYVLDLNDSLSCNNSEFEYPWNLPSRLMQFVLEVSEMYEDDDNVIHQRQVGLMHPLLREHPHVKRFEAETGIAVGDHGAPNEYGYTNVERAEWWHAVDLLDRGMWRELLDTARFTTRECIAGALELTLGSVGAGKKRAPRISLQDARAIMAAIDSPEPENIIELLGTRLGEPHEINYEKKRYWPINLNSPTLCEYSMDIAWVRIVGLERGWFEFGRDGYLNWAAEGIIEWRRAHGEAA